MKRERHPRGAKLETKLFQECAFCRGVGLKPGILATKHGDYGVRNIYKSEKELKLNEQGFCDECVRKHKLGL